MQQDRPEARMLFSPQRLLVIVACLLSLVTQLHAQATSREEEIRQQRTDKRARLWPERTSGIVKLFDNYTETGLVEGARSKKGKNGTQFLLGGMRSGNGTTFGVGYRRVDLWDEKVAFRVTARGTPRAAYMFDALPLREPFQRTTASRAVGRESPLRDLLARGQCFGLGVAPVEAAHWGCCGRNRMAPGASSPGRFCRHDVCWFDQYRVSVRLEFNLQVAPGMPKA
jgi:hypothetical protein